MGRLYLVDSYNVILQDRELNEILDYEGLAAARLALRAVAEAFARKSDARVRLIFDGAQDPHGHIEAFENSWIDVSFTSSGEKADERLVAVALECRRRGDKPVIVSDDVKGIREPLLEEGFALLSTDQFARLLRSGNPGQAGGREKALSETSRRSLEAEFLARDAAARRRAAEEVAARRRTEALRAAHEEGRKGLRPTLPPAAKGPQANPPESEQAPAATNRAGSGPPKKPAVRRKRQPSPEELRKKERGRRKQERRLALLQSRRKKD